ncbi:hypothetical protein N2152v2_010780 [Parachlorella kessleri]
MTAKITSLGQSKVDYTIIAVGQTPMAEVQAVPFPRRRPRPGEVEVIDLLDADSDEETHEGKVQRTDFGAGDPGERAVPVPEQCPICFDAIDDNFKHALVGCKHPFCLGCLRGYVSCKVADRAFPVGCPLPGCGGAITTAECNLVLTREEQEVLGKLEAEAAIPAPHKLYCPNKACSQLLLLDGEPPSDAEVQCPYCEQPLCAACRVPWHAGLSCQQFKELPDNMRGEDDRAFLSLAGKKKWRQCPRCKCMVERSSGCNAMRCRCGRCHATRGHMPLGQATGPGGQGAAMPPWLAGGMMPWGPPPDADVAGDPEDWLTGGFALHMPFVGLFRRMAGWLPGGEQQQQGRARALAPPADMAHAAHAEMAAALRAQARRREAVRRHQRQQQAQQLRVRRVAQQREEQQEAARARRRAARDSARGSASGEAGAGAGSGAVEAPDLQARQQQQGQQHTSATEADDSNHVVQGSSPASSWRQQAGLAGYALEGVGRGGAQAPRQQAAARGAQLRAARERVRRWATAEAGVGSGAGATATVAKAPDASDQQQQEQLVHLPTSAVAPNNANADDAQNSRAERQQRLGAVLAAWDSVAPIGRAAERSRQQEVPRPWRWAARERWRQPGDNIYQGSAAAAGGGSGATEAATGVLRPRAQQQLGQQAQQDDAEPSVAAAVPPGTCDNGQRGSGERVGQRGQGVAQQASSGPGRTLQAAELARGPAVGPSEQARQRADTAKEQARQHTGAAREQARQQAAAVGEQARKHAVMSADEGTGAAYVSNAEGASAKACRGGKTARRDGERAGAAAGTAAQGAGAAAR